jgi:hypothetical protein
MNILKTFGISKDVLAKFIIRNYSVGYFGIPGFNRAGGRVHLVRNHKPICGERLHPDAEYQWCGPGLYLDWIECKRCLERGTKIKSEAEKILNNLRRN